MHAALLAVSGAAKPFTEPLPNFNFSFADAILLSNPHAKKLAIVAPAPGSTPTKKPKTDVLPTTGAISLTSSLDNLIDPSLFKLASDALKLISSFLKIIMNASLIANVAITKRTKLIPSIKLMLPKEKRVISDKEVLSYRS